MSQMRVSVAHAGKVAMSGNPNEVGGCSCLAQNRVAISNMLSVAERATYVSCRKPTHRKIVKAITIDTLGEAGIVSRLPSLVTGDPRVPAVVEWEGGMRDEGRGSQPSCTAPASPPRGSIAWAHASERRTSAELISL